MSDPFDDLKAGLGDRYRIERELGRGGMATVYLAEDLKHERQVAIKVMHPELARGLGADRFLREIRIAAQLTHPHILPLHDSGAAAGSLYYVMPYIEGESLRDRLNREVQLPVDDALRIAREVSDALSHAHRAGVVHRDIKPENILLTGGHAVVADFGIAGALSAAGDDRLTVPGVTIGTPAYMSPEQVVGAEHIDGRSDVYSLGCVLYEMLAGQPPFAGPTAESVMNQHRSAQPPSVVTARSAVPDRVAAAVARALAKTPADRFDPAAQFAEALVSGAGSPGGSRPIPAMSRSLGFALVTAAAVVVLSVVAWLMLRHGERVLDADVVLVAGFENQTGDSSLAQLGSVALDWLTRGLQETGVIRVYDARLLAADPLGFASAGPRGVAQALAVAKDVGAGTMLSGTYYRQGDSLQFQVQFTDAATGELRYSLEPVGGSLQAPLEAVELLRQRVMTTLAVFAQLDLRTMPIKPPTYDAYREFMAGLILSAQRDLEGAARSALRAAALDTNFTGALLMASGMMIGSGQFARADSILAVVGGKRGRLSEFELLVADGQLARLRGNLVGWLSAARRVSEFLGPSFDLVEGALWLNRPQEAIDALAQLDPTDPLSGGRPDYWEYLHDAFHMRGDYEGALEAGSKGRAQYATSRRALLYDVETLAALGRLPELERRFGEAAALPPDGGAHLADMMLSAASELRVHGHHEASRAMVERFEDWASSRATDEAASPWHRYRLAVGLAHAGRWKEAKAQCFELIGEGFASLSVVGLLGAVSAAQGDSAEATKASEWLRDLEGRYLFGSNMLWRARIAAVRGEREEAVSLLRDAFAQGQSYGMWLHQDPAFESLREYPPFQELLRPKG